MGGAGTGERFGRQEFVQRVADRASARESEAVYGARVVLEVLDEATTGGMVGKVREALPPDLRQLLDAGSQATCLPEELGDHGATHIESRSTVTAASP